MKLLLSVAAGVCLLSGCAATSPIDGSGDTGGAASQDTGAGAGLDAAAADDDAAQDAPDADEPPDARAPGRDAGARDAGPRDAGTCAPLACKLNCPFGLRQDRDGCDVCACRECAQAKDCQTSCATPLCSPAGDCLCDCTTYKPAGYACPDGVTVPRCGCGPHGITCLDHPEYQCAGICTPGDLSTWACPEGTRVPWCTCNPPGCVPVCREIGSKSEGWYDGCSGALLGYAACAGCAPMCTAIGTKSEGWSDSCSGNLIRWGLCAPRFDCLKTPEAQCATSKCTAGETASYPCPGGGEVGQCRCTPPAAACPPVCRFVGTATEGWYDGCDSTLLQKAKCSACTATCDQVGSKSEGWFSSCGPALIAWAQCGTPAWQCQAAPWTLCTGTRPCLEEGAGWRPGEATGMCCPALDTLSLSLWDGAGCSVPVQEERFCSWCGDGVCRPPENRCDCAEDCWDPSPRGLGEGCSASAECASGLVCLQRWGVAAVGVCSRTCNPAAADCGADAVCLAVPEHAAAGYCLGACATSADCVAPLACGGQFGSTPIPQGGCFDWGPCDPLADDWCAPGQQCRLERIPTCGAPGKLGLRAACDPLADACGPGLGCANRLCVPVCRDDAACQAAGFDLCKLQGATGYGLCAVYE